jgi:hypothetical protein
MKIIDKELLFFGQEIRFRIVPRAFRKQLGEAGTKLTIGKWEEAETILNRMNKDFCNNQFDDEEMINIRHQILEIKKEINL